MQEKQAKRKLQEKVAKAIIAKNGAPLTISEHDSIMSKIKKETELARAALMEAMDSMPKSMYLLLAAFLHVNIYLNECPMFLRLD